MAPRANWKGFLRLSLVTCPVALFPATSESEKISFNQINRKTGHRIKYTKVDADSGDEVSNDDIIKGYKVDTDKYLEVSKDELDNIALALATVSYPIPATANARGNRVLIGCVLFCTFV
jgi:DNA end-binding protein Ku